LVGRSQQDFVQRHPSGAGDSERDHLSDVLGGDGQLLVELLGGLFHRRVGDVVGQLGGHGAGFDDGYADVGLQLLPQCLRPASSTSFADSDLRSTLPRFTEQARTANQALVDLLSAIAKRKSATPAQVALAWLLAQHPWIVPIPGTTKPHRLEENTAAVDVELTPDDLEEITAAADRVDVEGDRYPAHMQRWINR
jgi:hypothetical protein